METIRAKWVKDIVVIDPDSHGEVTVSIYKMETGGMIGVDGSFLEQDVGPIYSPFDNGIRLNLQEE